MCVCFVGFKFLVNTIGGYLIWLKERNYLAKGEVKKIIIELKRLHAKLDEMEASIAVTDSCTAEIFGEEEKIDDRLTNMEAEITGLKVENIELRNHLNCAIKELN